MNEERKCKHVLSNGSRCQAWALEGKELCFSHDPESREAKLEAVTKGGLAKEIELEMPLQKIIVASPSDVAFLLAVIIDEVRSGKLDIRIANTLGYLSNVLLKAFELAEVDEKAEQTKEVLKQFLKDRRRRNIYGR